MNGLLQGFLKRDATVRRFGEIIRSQAVLVDTTEDWPCLNFCLPDPLLQSFDRTPDQDGMGLVFYIGRLGAVEVECQAGREGEVALRGSACTGSSSTRSSILMPVISERLLLRCPDPALARTAGLRADFKVGAEKDPVRPRQWARIDHEVRCRRTVSGAYGPSARSSPLTRNSVSTSAGMP